MQLPAFLPIFVSSLLHHTITRGTSSSWVAGDVTLALVLWQVVPPYSILAIWRWTIILAGQWTKLPGIETVIPAFLIRGGPLGPGCGKVLEVLTGCLLWSYAYPSEALPIQLGPSPSLLTWVVVFMLSGLTNVILSLWSKQTKSRGDHAGVNTMVESSRGRVLSYHQHGQLLTWAIVNAICEEVASRGLWMHELARHLPSPMHANILQAISFGIWHFHGIPSGWTGVGLTFVYGLAMGFMFAYGGGLLLPIVAHSVADYFIFAVIARKGGF
jgi:membrane protease YdiL (CAAX protease family)